MLLSAAVYVLIRASPITHGDNSSIERINENDR